MNTPFPKSPRAAGHTPKKRFGQNFLQDGRVVDRIVALLCPKKDDNIVEIGPGLGALTEPLLGRVDALTVIELDERLASDLAARAPSGGVLRVIQADALGVDYGALAKQIGRGKLRVVGNLPYNVSTPLLFWLLRHKDAILDMHFMLQKEVVDRIAAPVGGKEYGRLSVMAQYHCYAQSLLVVPPYAFDPPPKVMSAVFCLKPFERPPVVAKDEGFFALVVRECFNHRRKTVRAILRSSSTLLPLTDDDFACLGIDPAARPQNLSVADFVALSDALLAKRACAQGGDA